MDQYRSAPARTSSLLSLALAASVRFGVSIVCWLVWVASCVTITWQSGNSQQKNWAGSIACTCRTSSYGVWGTPHRPFPSALKLQMQQEQEMEQQKPTCRQPWLCGICRLFGYFGQFWFVSCFRLSGRCRLSWDSEWATDFRQSGCYLVWKRRYLWW